MAQTQKQSSGKRPLADLLPSLKAAQAKTGSLSRSTLAQIAQDKDISLGQVYGVSSFYSFLNTKPTGKYLIRVCKSVPCCMADAEMILKTVEDEINLLPGQTSKDGLFSLELVNCIGACEQAPAILINDELHGNLTPAKIVEILKSYK